MLISCSKTMRRPLLSVYRCEGTASVQWNAPRSHPYRDKGLRRSTPFHFFFESGVRSGLQMLTPLRAAALDLWAGRIPRLPRPSKYWHTRRLATLTPGPIFDHFKYLH